MSRRVDPSFLYDLKAYGAVGAENCINCGNCTAICSLASDDDRFPRQVIRLAQLGLKDELLGSRELWLCFNCGDCSETCPQQAEPGNLMAAARSYAIAHYSPLKIGALFFRKPLLAGALAALLALLGCTFMWSERQATATVELELFGFIPYNLIHNAGLVLLVLVGLVSLASVVAMVARIARAQPPWGKQLPRGVQLNWLQAFWEAVVVQSLGQKRYRTICGARKSAQAWYSSKWFLHAATMWGFLGLLLATTLDYLLALVSVKAPGTFVPLWYPTRLIGTVAGLLFVYGVSGLLYKRVRAPDKAYSHSRASDWIFLALLWFSGVTGFVIEIALYLPGAPRWGYWVFILHVAVSVTLLALLPFTKFAHAIYRLVALYVQALKPLGKKEAATAGAK